MNPKTVKKALKDAIQAMTDYKWLFSARDGKDNTRNRKFPFQKVIPFILAFRGGTLNHEIMDFFGLNPSAGTSSLIICHAHQESTTLLYSLNCISESFAFLSQIPRVKPLLRIWMHPLSLYMILRGFMRCAGVLRPLSAT